MLSLGAGSSCDICFEIFGQDLKAACSISCGHVFCIECIAQLTTRICPMCRTEFDEDSCIRLHVDMDNAPASADQSSGKCSLDDISKARGFAEAYASITDQGTTESRLRQVILDGRQFLAGQPKHLFRDLRVTHRLIAYLCEVKATLRTQNQAVESLNEQIKQLTSEKEEVVNQIAELESLRNYEKETALAVETSLRSHCDNAVKLYHGMIEMFNKVVTQNAELLSQSATASTSASTSHAEAPGSSIFNILPPVDAQALKGIAIQDPRSSLLISPLPQFTGALPSILDGFTPLPELTEDAEEEDERSDEEDEVPTPDSAQHRTFQAAQEAKPRPSARSSADPLPPLRSEMRIPEPSGLSRSAPYLEHRRARSRSNPSPMESRSHSPSSSNSTPPMSSPQHLASYQPPSSRRGSGSSTRDGRTSSPRGVQAQDGEVLRTRLHDILHHAPPTSTSLPSMASSHFPSSFANRDRGAEPSSPPERQRSREREGRVSPPPPRAGSSSTSKVPGPSSTDSVSQLLASHPQQTPNKPPSSTSPNPLVGLRYTTASAEAKKLEEERRKKVKEEKYALEQERQAAEAAEREREAYRPKASPTSASNSAGQSSRWDSSSNAYSTPVSSSHAGASFPGSSSLKRGSSTNNGTYGRSGSGLPPPPLEHTSGQHPRYSGSNSKSWPPVLPSNPASIST